MPESTTMNVAAPTEPFRADPALPRRAFLLAGSCAGALALSHLLKPTKLVAAQGPKVVLEAHVPETFGSWRIDRSIVPLEPSPDVVAQIESIYDATLARTYVNDKGQRIMLSIAYGGDQSGRMRVHRPEACYSAQGFHVRKLRDEAIDSGQGSRIEAKRLMARLGPRPEPITYWIRVGKSTVAGNMGQRMVQLQYGINGEVPDGLLFRVSSVDSDPEYAFRIHDQFVRELLAAVSPASRHVLTGG